MLTKEKKKSKPKPKHRTPKVAPLGKIHGGKGDGKARQLIEIHPAADTYDKHVEPCGGLASVKMNLAVPGSGRVDIYNDVNARLSNMFSMIRSSPDGMTVALQTTLYSEADFKLANCEAHYSRQTDIEKARLTYIQYAMSFSGRLVQFGRTTERIRRGMASEVSAHLSKIDKHLPNILDIVSTWSIENWDVLKCIKKHDGLRTMFYIDPPYLPETRVKGARKIYPHEMTYEDHEALLKAIVKLKGKVLLSGYDSELYRDTLTSPKWHSYYFCVNNQASGPGQTRIRVAEHVWTNYLVKPRPKWLVKI